MNFLPTSRPVQYRPYQTNPGWLAIAPFYTDDGTMADWYACNQAWKETERSQAVAAANALNAANGLPLVEA